MSWKNILLLLSVIALIHGVVIYGCMQSDSDAVDAAAAKAAEELHNRQLALFYRLFSAPDDPDVPEQFAVQKNVEPWKYGENPTLPPNLLTQSRGAKSVILIDLESRRVIFEYNSRNAVPIASLTKLMSLLVVSEKIKADPSLSMSKMVELSSAARSVENAKLKAGKYSIKDLMYSMIVGSFNDAATQLAITCCGSVPEFVKEMNQKAAAMGLKNAKFNSPSGLPQDGVNSFASAGEVAMLCEAVMKNPDLAKICSTARYTLENGSKRRGGRDIGSDNRMINGRNVPGAFGFKTGFTNAAGRCVAFGVKRNGRTIIGVTTGFGDRNKLFDFSIALTEWAFKNTKVGN